MTITEQVQAARANLARLRAQRVIQKAVGHQFDWDRLEAWETSEGTHLAAVTKDREIRHVGCL